MQQFIYAHGSLSDRQTAINSLLAVENYLLLHLSGLDSPLKISEIRTLQASLAITSNKPRVVWIEEAQSLTLPAQHALLKTLEEPPEGVILALSLPSPHSLLPTIRSRCRIIKVTPTPIALDHQQLTLVKEALSAPPGLRLQLAGSLGKNRPANILVLEQIILTLHQVLKTSDNPKALKLLAKISASAHLALTRLRSNTNVTLTLESFFLSLPKVS